MTEIRFQLRQTPKGDWRLTEGGQDRGLYESPAKGEAAIKILLSPVIYNYDPNGDIIK